jgi:hypothetical protein
MRMPACFVSLGVSALLVSGCPRQRASTQSDAGGDVAVSSSTGDAATAAAPRIDGARMAALVTALADDQLGGRYTFAEADIARAAEMLGQAYREGGLAPVGKGFRVDYPVITGVQETAPTTIAITRADAKLDVPATAFVARSNSASGTVTGEVVFVGYAVRSRAEGDAKSDVQAGVKDDAIPAYDDLAGIDVKGKVALVLLETPGRPDGEAIFAALRARASAFERST